MKTMDRKVYYCSELYHHGIPGQSWGKRNGPPYPLDPKDRSAKERRLASKFTNIDGSLNEKGKAYRDHYTYKKTSQNDKYYEKYKVKYQNKADKALKKGNEAEYNKWMDKKKSAEESRVSVNKSIMEMPIADIIKDVRNTKSKNIKKGLAIAGAAALTGGAVAFGVNAVLTGQSIFPAIVKGISNVSYDSIRKGALAVAASPIGLKVKDAVDTAIRLYADARGYVVGTVLRQSIYNLQDSGALDAVVSTASNAVSNIKGDAASAVGNVVKNQAIGEAYVNIAKSAMRS